MDVQHSKTHPSAGLAQSRSARRADDEPGEDPVWLLGYLLWSNAARPGRYWKPLDQRNSIRLQDGSVSSGTAFVGRLPHFAHPVLLQLQAEGSAALSGIPRPSLAYGDPRTREPAARGSALVDDGVHRSRPLPLLRCCRRCCCCCWRPGQDVQRTIYMLSQAERQPSASTVMRMHYTRLLRLWTVCGTAAAV